MSNKEFWEEDPDLFWAYRFSYINRKREEAKEIEYVAWLNGAYINDAVSVAINNCFNKQKLDYPLKPYSEMKAEDSIENEVIKIQNRIAKVQAIFKEKEKNERKEE